MRQYRSKWPSRRGMAVPEWFAVAGGITLGVMLLLSTAGESVRDYLNDTAGGVGDPSKLVERFGPRSTVDSSTGNARQNNGGHKGDNGVGNGSDDGPSPGNSPENDGEGTSPGNPGNKGGAKKNKK